MPLGSDHGSEIDLASMFNGFLLDLGWIFDDVGMDLLNGFLLDFN